MAARSPRRTFAAPFVVTLAAVPACYVDSTTPPPRQPQPVVSAPQPEPDTGGETVMANPPRPTPAPEPTPATTPPTKAGGGAVVQTGGTATTPASPAPSAPPTATTYPFDQRWTVTKSGTGCLAYAQVDCPKPAKKGDPVPTCNPPPPMAIACPDGVTASASVTVVQYANQSECMVEPAPVKCPPNVMCNPPPPRKVACPTRR